MPLLTGKLPYADMLVVGGNIMDWGLFLVVGGLYETTELINQKRFMLTLVLQACKALLLLT